MAGSFMFPSEAAAPASSAERGLESAQVVATILRSDLLSFAKHRNASYLVEKALSYCALEAGKRRLERGLWMGASEQVQAETTGR